MLKTINNRRFGFTLLELLVVLAIIVALVALLAPLVMTQRERSNQRIAQSWIGNFEKSLDLYYTDFGHYPTTEQGLNALIFVPLNEGQYAQGMVQQPGYANPNDPNAGGMNLGASGIGGPDAFNTPMPGGPNTLDPMGGGVSLGLGGTAPPFPNAGFAGDPNAMGGGISDPNMMGGTGYGGTWTEPQFNPQLYINAKKRSDQYLAGSEVPSDPWKRPYRYSYNLVNGINPLTGDRKPAIWSAGYDGIDNTEDDLRSWNPKVAAEQLALQQQQMMYGGGTGGVDAMGNPLQPGAMGGGFDAMGNPLQPGMSNDMMMQPGGMTPPGGMVPPGGMMPPGGMTPPGGMMPPGGMTPPSGMAPPQPPM